MYATMCVMLLSVNYLSDVGSPPEETTNYGLFWPLPYRMIIFPCHAGIFICTNDYWVNLMVIKCVLEHLCIFMRVKRCYPSMQKSQAAAFHQLFSFVIPFLQEKAYKMTPLSDPVKTRRKCFNLKIKLYDKKCVHVKNLFGGISLYNIDPGTPKLNRHHCLKEFND